MKPEKTRRYAPGIILLTGASGLLGANVARELVKRGYRLKVLMRPGSDQRGIANLPCTIITGDLHQPETLKKALEGCEFLIHGAARTDQWPSDLPAFVKTNVEGTIYLVEAAKQMQIRKMIYVSTANTVGPGTKEFPGVECNTFHFSALNSGYINSKFMSEQYIQDQVRASGFPAVIVNPSFLIGPWDLKPSSGKLLLHAFKSRIQLVPPGGKNFVYAGDAAVAICNALEKGKPGERYLLVGENLSYKEFFDLVNQYASRTPTQIPLPAFLLKIMGQVGDVWGKLTGKAEINRITAKLCCCQTYYSGKKAIRDLGLPQTPVKEAIAEAIHWFENTKVINVGKMAKAS